MAREQYKELASSNQKLEADKSHFDALLEEVHGKEAAAQLRSAVNRHMADQATAGFKASQTNEAAACQELAVQQQALLGAEEETSRLVEAVRKANHEKEGLESQVRQHANELVSVQHALVQTAKQLEANAERDAERDEAYHATLKTCREDLEAAADVKIALTQQVAKLQKEAIAAASENDHGRGIEEQLDELQDAFYQSQHDCDEAKRVARESQAKAREASESLQDLQARLSQSTAETRALQELQLQLLKDTETSKGELSAARLRLDEQTESAAAMERAKARRAAEHETVVAALTAQLEQTQADLATVRSECDDAKKDAAVSSGEVTTLRRQHASDDKILTADGAQLTELTHLYEEACQSRDEALQDAEAHRRAVIDAHTRLSQAEEAKEEALSLATSKEVSKQEHLSTLQEEKAKTATWEAELLDLRAEVAAMREQEVERKEVEKKVASDVAARQKQLAMGGLQEPERVAAEAEQEKERRREVCRLQAELHRVKHDLSVAEDDNLRLAKKLQQVDDVVSSLKNSSRTLLWPQQHPGTEEKLARDDTAEEGTHITGTTRVPSLTRTTSHGTGRELHNPRQRSSLLEMRMLLTLGGSADDTGVGSTQRSGAVTGAETHEGALALLQQQRRQEEMRFAGEIADIKLMDSRIEHLEDKLKYQAESLTTMGQRLVEAMREAREVKVQAAEDKEHYLAEVDRLNCILSKSELRVYVLIKPYIRSWILRRRLRAAVETAQRANSRSGVKSQKDPR